MNNNTINQYLNFFIESFEAFLLGSNDLIFHFDSATIMNCKRRARTGTALAHLPILH